MSKQLDFIKRYAPNISQEAKQFAASGIGLRDYMRETNNREHIDKGLDHWDSKIRQAAAFNPNATKDQIHKALDDIEAVRGAAMGNPSATKEHLDRGIIDESAFVREEAAASHNATKEHLDMALNDQDEFVRQAAAENPNATKQHLDKALVDENKYVVAAAKRNRRYKEFFPNGHE